LARPCGAGGGVVGDLGGRHGEAFLDCAQILSCCEGQNKQLRVKQTRRLWIR
jgi:hypothetical protein